MKIAKLLSKIIIMAIFLLAICSISFAATADVVLNGTKKGSVTTREMSGRTEIAADELISVLGYRNSGDAANIVVKTNDKKIEIWNNSDVVRVCGNMAMLASPAAFANGHLWIDKKSAAKIFNQYNALTGQGTFNFAGEYIANGVTGTQKTAAVKPVQTTKQQKTTRRMTVKQLIAERQKKRAQAGQNTGKTETAAFGSGMSDTDRFLAELEAKNKAARKKEAVKQNNVAKKGQSAATENIAAKTEAAAAAAETGTIAQTMETENAAIVAPGSAITKEFTRKRPCVVIDAGHGAHDPGAIGHSVREKDINLKAAITLGNILKQYGANVLYTRSTDIFLKLQERTAFANKNNADVFVSLHCNSLPKGNDSVKGIEIYLMASPRDKDSLRLAIEENKEVSGSANSVADLEKADKKTRLLLKILGDMQQTNKISESTQLIESLDKALRTNKLQLRKVSQAPFFVLRGAGMPAVLIEMGYLSSAADAKKLNNAAYREQLMRGVAQGVVSYIKTHIKL